MDLENVEETASEESSDEMSESESENETSVNGWEGVTMGDKEPKAYTFARNSGAQFNLPDSEPMDYFSLFFIDEGLSDIVIETGKYAKTQNFLSDIVIETGKYAKTQNFETSA
jgi:hypothetical protein